jgi:hypothetical protein
LAGGNSIEGNQAFDTNTLYVDAVNDRVGVLDATPDYAFDLASGEAYLNGVIVSGSSAHYLNSASCQVVRTNGGGVGDFAEAGNLTFVPRTSTGNPKSIIFYTGETTPLERMRVTGAGYVGIGTTTPQTNLHFAGQVRQDFNAGFLRLSAYTSVIKNTSKTLESALGLASHSNIIGQLRVISVGSIHGSAEFYMANTLNTTESYDTMGNFVASSSSLASGTTGPIGVWNESGTNNYFISNCDTDTDKYLFLEFTGVFQ